MYSLILLFLAGASAQTSVELIGWQFEELIKASSSSNTPKVVPFDCNNFPNNAPYWSCSDTYRTVTLNLLIPKGAYLPSFVPGPTPSTDDMGYCVGTSTIGPFPMNNMLAVMKQLATIIIHYKSHFIVELQTPDNYDFYNGSPLVVAHYTGKPLDVTVSLKEVDNMLYALSQLAFKQTQFHVDEHVTAIDLTGLALATGSKAYSSGTSVPSIIKFFNYTYVSPFDKNITIISPDYYYTVFFYDPSAQNSISAITYTNPGLQLVTELVEETEISKNIQFRPGITVAHRQLMKNVPIANYGKRLTPIISFFHSENYLLSSWLRFQNYYTYKGLNITSDQLSQSIPDSMRNLVYVQCNERPDMCSCKGNYSSQAMAIGALGYDSIYTKRMNTVIYPGEKFHVHSPIMSHVGSVPKQGRYQFMDTTLPNLPDFKAVNIPSWLPESLGEEINGVLDAVQNIYEHIQTFWEILQHIEEIITAIQDITSLKPTGGAPPEAVPV
ncbi:hypothetical protein [Beihai hepe-like virus 9]|uniref:hypothetical protein n=1 Tax=Beihai hepe-like virus 9 TaxID=1922386 RepID=UPI00090A948F|nr:hypothetical protein [Beihai hepe-like virus 9]APG77628.1 hypothetical protein [Beihai hepe-like virus 9]